MWDRLPSGPPAGRDGTTAGAHRAAGNYAVGAAAVQAAYLAAAALCPLVHLLIQHRGSRVVH